MDNYQAKKIAPTQGVDLTNNATYYIHPVFGIQSVDENNFLKRTAANAKEEYEDFVPRELGISRMIVENNKLYQGLVNPATYLDNKNKDLEAIGVKLSKLYQEQNVKYINSGFSLAQARRAALQFAESMRGAYMHEHELNFPIEVTKDVISKLQKKRDVK